MFIEIIKSILLQPVVLVALVIIIVMVIIAAIAKNKNSHIPAQENTEDEKMPYTLKESVLTKAEFDFARVLGQYAPRNSIILTKINLQDIFSIDESDYSKYTSYRNRINRRHVDFLICDMQTFKPLYGIELDDSSHNTQKAKQRDEFINKVYNHAGLKLIHIKCKREYTQQDFQEIIEFNYFLEQSHDNAV